MSARTVRALAAVALLSAACGGAGASHQDAISLPQPSAHAAVAAPGALDQPIGKTESTAPVPIAEDDAAWGSRTAPVTVVEYADFQCPFCARAADTVEQLKKEYGAQKLRVVFKHFPLSFHPNAAPCAEAAAAVRALGGNAAFWTFYDLAYHHQEYLSPASYESWAERAGVPRAKFRAAIDAHTYAPRVQADATTGQSIGVEGTPAFFVNGVSIVGAQPVEKFREVIDAELVAAKAKLDKGVAPRDLYAVATKENFHAPSARHEDDAPPPDTTTVWKVPIGASPARGPKTALVTIVEFGDLQDPFSKRADATLKQLMTDYGANLRLVFKHDPLPFHHRAEPAAELALEARAEKGDAGFWAAHDALLAAQPKLDDADLDRIASELKLDVAKARAAVAKQKHARTIEQDQIAADDLAVEGTPTFFINGRRLGGAQPVDQFKAIIDDELAKAKALVAAGTKPEKVYDELTKNGKTPTPPAPKTVALASSAPSKGAAHPTVTIVEFADFQCPFCKRATTTLDALLKAYPRQVRLVWRNMPLSFHRQAELAAEAGVEAFRQKGNAGFWRMHEALYKHQAETDGLSRGSLDGYARGFGLDMAKFGQALDTGANASAVDADAQAAKTAGVTGAPTFFIGRGAPTASWSAYELVGAQPLWKFKRLVDLALGTHP